MVCKSTIHRVDNLISSLAIEHKFQVDKSSTLREYRVRISREDGSIYALLTATCEKPDGIPMQWQLRSEDDLLLWSSEYFNTFQVAEKYFIEYIWLRLI